MVTWIWMSRRRRAGLVGRSFGRFLPAGRCRCLPAAPCLHLESLTGHGLAQVVNLLLDELDGVVVDAAGPGEIRVPLHLFGGGCADGGQHEGGQNFRYGFRLPLGVQPARVSDVGQH